MMKEFWNQRYSAANYAYGKEPNNWLAEQLKFLQPGRILLPAEGEGRNAVYAARLGWQVQAFDMSEQGKAKALALAAEHGVSIEYTITTADAAEYPAQSFDAIALIYAHFHSAVRTGLHRKWVQWLKPGGVIILEGFSQNNLTHRQANPGVGGPADVELLYTPADIASDFAALQTIELSEQVIELSEGDFHVGQGSVVRYTGRLQA